MLITSWGVRSGHLDLVREREERLAHGEHPVDHLLRKAGIDQVGKSDISAGGVELLADPLGVLAGKISCLSLRSERIVMAYRSSTISELGKVDEWDRGIYRWHDVADV